MEMLAILVEHGWHFPQSSLVGYIHSCTIPVPMYLLETVYHKQFY